MLSKHLEIPCVRKRTPSKAIRVYGVLCPSFTYLAIALAEPVCASRRTSLEVSALPFIKANTSVLSFLWPPLLTATSRFSAGLQVADLFPQRQHHINWADFCFVGETIKIYFSGIYPHALRCRSCKLMDPTLALAFAEKS